LPKLLLSLVHLSTSLFSLLNWISSLKDLLEQISWLTLDINHTFNFLWVFIIQTLMSPKQLVRFQRWHHHGKLWLPDAIVSSNIWVLVASQIRMQANLKNLLGSRLIIMLVLLVHKNKNKTCFCFYFCRYPYLTRPVLVIHIFIFKTKSFFYKCDIFSTVPSCSHKHCKKYKCPSFSCIIYLNQLNQYTTCLCSQWPLQNCHRTQPMS